ncbi:hypothetical protein IE53DRAFT_389049, partial [Violaceomyces palustris]
MRWTHPQSPTHLLGFPRWRRRLHQVLKVPPSLFSSPCLSLPSPSTRELVIHANQSRKKDKKKSKGKPNMLTTPLATSLVVARWSSSKRALAAARPPLRDLHL